MKIKYNIFIILFCLSVVPLFTMGILIINSNSKKIGSIMEDNLKIVTSIEVNAINTFLDQRLLELELLSKIAVVKELLIKGPEWDWISSVRYYADNILKQSVEINDFSESLTILDKDFRIVSSSSKLYTVGEISEAKDFKKELFENQIGFSDIFFSKHSNREQKEFAAMKSIYYNNELYGYIVAELNLSYFDSVRETAKITKNQTIYIVDGNNNVITAGNSTQGRDDFVLSPEERINYTNAFKSADLKKNPEGMIRYKIKNNNYITYYSPLKFTNWMILTSVNIDNVTQNQEQYKQIGLVLLTIFICILITVNYLVTKKIVKPVNNIIDILRKVRENQNYDLRVKYVKKDELGTISNDINSLLDYIETNIHAERKKQEVLKEKANKDSLTQVLNKGRTEEVMRRELAQAAKKSCKLAFLFVDVDDFKSYNTKYGHLVGDRVLLFIANLLQEKSKGYVGRIGGDEFVICIVDNEEMNNLVKIADGIIKLLNFGLTVDEEEEERIPVCCSIGIAVYPDAGSTYEELLERADAAMYEVKNRGKNGYQFAEATKR